ncbi:MAG TPA: M48 family metallopeptidase [Pseudomonadales bacterium]|nr:M48 family metallopeptidase [Pseudomonadales bacterium]
MKSFTPVSCACNRIVLVCCALLLGSCVTSPTGRSQFIMVGDQEMNSMGQQAFAQMKQQKPPVQDAAANARVECVVNALTTTLGADMRSGWEIRVFVDDTPNAFALPGKKVGVHTGMLKLVQNDAQLAAVIGHEIGHVLAKHANERASIGMLQQVTQEVAGQINPVAASVFGLGTQLGVMLPFSRTQEAEADIIGQEMMARAGFDPQESVALWRLMEKKEGDGPPEFLSTHPSGNERINQLGKNLYKASPLYRQAQAAGKHPRCH